jgi:AraC-like DNA-binding protein
VVVATHATAAFIRPHAHPDETQVLVPLSGIIRVETETALWIVPPGKAIVIPASIVHAVSAPVAATLCTLRLDGTVWPVSGHGERTIAMTPLALAMVEAVTGMTAPPLPGTFGSRLAALLLEILRDAPPDGFHVRRPRDPRLRQIVEALMQDPSDPASLSDWGRRVGASDRTLSRLFETEIGMGFRDCRRSIQIHSAVARLGSGQALTEIAADLGYESLSAFIHAFRTVVGETPGQMARRLGARRAAT